MTKLVFGSVVLMLFGSLLFRWLRRFSAFVYDIFDDSWLSDSFQYADLSDTDGEISPSE